MPDIKLLDCTLRDGGYINNWDFGFSNSKAISDTLIKANIDYVELGFLTKENSSKNKTLFNDFNDLLYFSDSNITKEKLCVMINYGNFPPENIINEKHSPVKNIRLIFKKHKQKDALNFANQIKDRGFKLFVNPTFIAQYNKDELHNLIDKINKIEPFAMTIVDSTGSLREDTLKILFEIINDKLNKNITLGFHSHNNLNLSFSNAKKIIEINKERNLIIDSSIMGMGRGAGNLKTEIITQFLNENYSKNYKTEEISKIAKTYIEDFYKKYPWNNTQTYFLSAINNCHPDYAKFIQENFSLTKDLADKAFKNIPLDKRNIYDLKEITEICQKLS